ncbi:MAG: methyl-accepting chemotaxis protein [Alsobacter sp.]
MRLQSLNTKFGAAFMAAGLLACVVGAIVAVASAKLGAALDDLRKSATILRQHTLGDMYHDGLRAQVYFALHDARSKTPHRDETLKDLEQTVQSFQTSIQTISTLSRGDAVGASIETTRPPLEAYIAAARTLIATAYADLPGAEAQLPDFDERFSALEKALDALGDEIEANGQSIEQQGQAVRQQALLASIVGATVLVLIILAGYGWLTQQFVGPVRRMAVAIGLIKDGVADVAIPGLTRTDEIGDVARSVERISSLGRDNKLVVAALDGSDSMLMITDPDERMVYVSATLVQLLMRLEPIFREQKIDFSIDQMVGQHIDYYRTNPALKRDVLLDDGRKRRVRYTVGGLVINVDMTYIYDADGERVGHTLIWRNVTEELAAQDAVASVVGAAALGDFSRRLSVDDKTGFVKDIAEGLNTLSATVETAMSDVNRALRAVAQGDLTHEMARRYDGVFGELQDGIRETTEHLAETVATLQSTAAEVAAAAAEIEGGAGDLSRRTEDQASSLEETAATTEQLAASVKATAHASRDAVTLAREASGVARTGGSIVSNAVEAMARIEQASRKISDITGVIDEIAFQTNLLALNAAVEAARAGEAGKGFAVVASEVRTLAQRSSDAAKDITALISASDQEVAGGVKLVREAGDVLGRIVDASERVSGMVGDISSATGEQANGIDEMSQAVAHMDHMTQQNAALAEESVAAATSLAGQIERLNAIAATFRTRQSGHGRGDVARASSSPLRRAS